jgi:hypothetical protein
MLFDHKDHRFRLLLGTLEIDPQKHLRLEYRPRLPSSSFTVIIIIIIVFIRQAAFRYSLSNTGVGD